MAQREIATYDNAQWNIPLHGKNSPLYGLNDSVPDPFVMRFNGKYYLYCTTSGKNRGLQGFKSDDLVDWIPCHAEGLEEGFVSSRTLPETENAYAPEVYYHDGTFYCYISPAGTGHLVLTSSSPEGPFVPAGGRLDERKIDASLFFAENGRKYYFYAATGHIAVRELSDMTHPTGEERAVSGTDSIGGWTEGPMVIERGEKLFLSYTGNHYLSTGYRIEYATAPVEAQGDLETLASSFRRGAGGRLLINTRKERGFTGLGHSSFVLGPDLDSLYMAYHCLLRKSSGKVMRSFNLDRVWTSGGYMTTSHRPYGSMRPDMPDFSAYGVAEAEQAGQARLLFLAGREFTAEYNFIGSADLLFGWRENGHCGVRCDFQADALILYRMEESGEKILKTAPLGHFKEDRLHTVRIASDGEKVSVFFDNVCRFRGEKCESVGGKIGYLSKDWEHTEVGFTVVGRYAFGSSDHSAVKPCGTAIPALLTAGGKDCPREDYPVLTLSRGEEAEYPFYVHESGIYAFRAATSFGGKVEIVCGKTRKTARIPLGQEECYAQLCSFRLQKGVHTVRVRAADACGLHAVGLYRVGKSVFGEGREFSLEGKRKAEFFKGEHRDFTLTLSDLSFEGRSGVLLRVAEYSESEFDGADSLTGYLLHFGDGKIALRRCDYGTSRTLCRAEYKPFEALTVQAEGNTFRIYGDKKLLLECTDPIAVPCGKTGLCALEGKIRARAEWDR